MTEILIATIGTESQVVTLSLLALARLGFKVTHVAVVHTASQDARILEGVRRLKEAFAHDPRLQGYHYQTITLQGEDVAIEDITTQREAEYLFNNLLEIIQRYKGQGYRLHLNVAGGRKPMSIYGMVAAQILFDEHDKLWHMVSNDALVKSRRLFPEADEEYDLVPIPVIRWQDLRQQNKDSHLRVFWESYLTEDEREVARLMATGLENPLIAKELNYQLNTIEKRVGLIQAKWVNFWELDEKTKPRRDLVARLAAYFERNPQSGKFTAL